MLMLALYRSLLYLYPAAYRCEYGDEMMEVLLEVHAVTRERNALARMLSAAHESGGLLYGALWEHFRSITGSHNSGIFLSTFSSRRFAMRSEFRFPKATVALMTVILAAVVFTIEKAKSISASVPHTSQPVGPIHMQFTIVPTLLAVLVGTVVAGVFGWAVLHALHRSGTHRLSKVHPTGSQGSIGGLS